MKSFTAFGALAASSMAEQTDFVQGGTLKLDWKDCGAQHGKVTGLSPTTLALGQETAVTGSGSVDEAVTGGKFSLEVKAGGGIVHKTFNGDICESSTFNLPVGAGSITWDGLNCPVAAGKVSVGTKIKMAGALPASLARAAITIKGAGTNGDDLLCMGINTEPAAEEVMAEPVKQEFVQGGTLKLNWNDCGAKHGKVTDLSPTTLALGQETAVTGSGNVDEAVTGGKFSLEVKAGGGIVHKTFNGDICESSTFNLPVGAGSITWDGLNCPVAAGKVSVGTKIKMAGALPASLARAAITIKGAGSNGDDLLCMGINTVPAAAEEVMAEPVEQEFVQGGTLKLNWSDCGAKHGKVTGLSPTTLALGQETAVTGSGSVDEAVTGGKFSLEVKAGGGIVHKTFNGNICEASTFNLPVGAGSITWDGLNCPVAAGKVSVGTKIKMAGALPASLARAAITIKGAGTNGDDLLCMGINTEPAAEEVMAEPVQQEFAQGGTLKLNWSDCGAAHGKVTGLSPTTLALGQETAVTGSGNVDEAVTGGKFSLEVKAGGGIVHKTFNGDICKASTFNLPVGAGSITWDGLNCPVAAGKVSVGTKIKMAGALPASLARAAITIKGAGTNGDDLLCMGINTEPATEEVMAEPVAQEFVQGGTLKLNWNDCGAKHGKVTGLSPTTLALGQETAVTGSGNVDEAVTGGMFSLEVKAGGGIVHKTFNGNICEASTFNLPVGAGSITWDGLNCPVAAGKVSVGTKIKMAGALPASLARAAITIKGAGTKGEELLCMGINTEPAMADAIVVV